MRRILLPLIAAVLALAADRGAAAQASPTRAIGIVMVCPPGGSSDSVARVPADALSARLNGRVVVKRDGSIRFTDPPLGVLGFHEGAMATPEPPTNVYRVDGQTGAIQVMTGDVNRPNGLAFSADERILHVLEAAATPRVIRAFDVSGAGAQTRLANSRTFFQGRDGETPGGFRADVDGNLWVGWGMGTAELDGVRIINAAGASIGRIGLPERCANAACGGRFRDRLSMAASRSFCSIHVNTRGVAGG